MNCSTADVSVLPYHPELSQTHVHWVRDAIHPSLTLPALLALLPSIIPALEYFFNEPALDIRWPSIGSSASASVLQMNIQGGFFSTQLSLLSSSQSYMTTGKTTTTTNEQTKKTSVQMNRLVRSDSMHPHRLQHNKLLCPSPTIRACCCC